MKVCNCELPNINPNACINCRSNGDYDQFYFNKIDYSPPEINKANPKIIEEHYENGQLIKRIIKE
jgi:hypothetical protein